MHPDNQIYTMLLTGLVTSWSHHFNLPKTEHTFVNFFFHKKSQKRKILQYNAVNHHDIRILFSFLFCFFFFMPTNIFYKFYPKYVIKLLFLPFYTLLFVNLYNLHQVFVYVFLLLCCLDKFVNHFLLTQPIYVFQ